MSHDTCANPVLLGWVKEWWDTAREQNSKGITTYKHAYDSLRACPIAFDHPSSLQQLKGFGPKLCERLTEKLRKHCEENGTPMPAHPGSKKRSAGEERDGDGNDAAGPSRPAKKARKPKAYVPAFRSGAYALVVALSAAGEQDTVGMTKAELIQEAQPHCDASFSAPRDPTKFYTAWNSMKTLVQKELVYERGRPLKRYALTDDGWEVAGRIREAAAAKAGGGSVAADSTTAGTGSSRPAPPTIHSASSRPAVPSTTALEHEEEPTTAQPSTNNPELRDVMADGAAPSEGTDLLPTFTPIVLAPGSFTIELVLDTREVRAKTDRDYMQQELAKQGVTPTVRALELGDAMWVARCKTPGWLARHPGHADGSDEVVLDWIVERKRLDDLLGSLRDGRFHEQKFRLRRSGVPNVVYVVEEISMDAAHFQQRHEEAVRSALAAMQVVNGYFVKRTGKMDETVRYLAALTGMLRELYAGRALSVVPTAALTTRNYLPLLAHLRETRPGESHHVSYAAFAALASKSSNMALRDLFLKMLMCTKGVTGEKAMEIQRVWRTPNEFVKAYEGCGEGEGGRRRKNDLVASRLGHLVARKKIGRPLSQKLAEVWADL